MSARTITGTVKAWLTEHEGPEVLNEPPEKAIGSISFFKGDMRRHGWTQIGTAEITVTIANEREIIESKVQSLRAQKQDVLANAELQANQLERKIQNLLAIEHDQGGAA